MALEFLQRIKVPHVYTLLVGVILACTLLTYVVPSGNYQREAKQVGGSTRTVVVPDSYEQVPKHITLKSVVLKDSYKAPEGQAEEKATPVGLLGFISAVPRGMEDAAYIIFFIFIIGGAFGVLQHTGVITAAIQALLRSFGDNAILLTIGIMVVLSLGGSTLGMGEEFIPLVPIFLLVSKRLGFDRIYGLALVILAAQIGFAAATYNPFTVMVAKGIAELDPGSGMTFRWIFYVTAISITIAYVIRYGQKIRKDPSASIMADDPFELAHDTGEDLAFTKRHVAIAVASLAIFGFVLFGSSQLHWSFAEMAGGFFLMGLVAAKIGGLDWNETAKAFGKGMEEMVLAALVVGFAKGIEVVLTDGQIMDTVIYFAASHLEDVPSQVAVQGMFAFQTFLNFLIPSGSGQAAVTMPIMAPLADVLGITRQTAVFAFQVGDGLSNTIIPTSGILMSMLTLAGIPYEKWLRFMVPLFLILTVTGAIFLVIAVSIGYS